MSLGHNLVKSGARVSYKDMVAHSDKDGIVGALTAGSTRPSALDPRFHRSTPVRVHFDGSQPPVIVGVEPLKPSKGLSKPVPLPSSRDSEALIKHIAMLEEKLASKKKKVKKAKSEKSWWDKGLDLAAEWLPKLAPLVISGLGDYRVRTNSLLAKLTHDASVPILGGEVPKITNTHCGVIVPHREYLGDILSQTSAFVSQRFPVNPGLSSTFPYLATMANMFQQYRIRGMIFEFLTLATDYSANPAIGYVAMASQYNVLDQPFTSKLQMLNQEYSSEKRSCESFLHPIECAPEETPTTELYTRNGPLKSGDLRYSDLCVVTVAVGGQPTANYPIGSLYVSYEIEFLKPKLGADYDQLVSSFSNSVSVGNAACLGAPPSFVNVGPLPVVCGDLGTSLTFPSLGEGTYLLVLNWLGDLSGPVLVAPPTVYSVTSIINNGNSSFPTAGSTAYAISSQWNLTITSNSPTPMIKFGTATLPTASLVMWGYMVNLGASTLADGPVLSRKTLREALRNDPEFRAPSNLLHNQFRIDAARPEPEQPLVPKENAYAELQRIQAELQSLMKKI